MGRSNRPRRAEKVRRRAKQHETTRLRSKKPTGAPGEPPPFRLPPPPDRELVLALLGQATWAPARQAATLATELAGCHQRTVHAEAERMLLIATARLWSNGWQPAEVIRQARRGDATAEGIWLAAIAADHSMRAPSTLHQKWAEQIQALGLPVVDGPHGWLSRALDQADRHSAMVALVSAMPLCTSLGTVAQILPPPGTSQPHGERQSAGAISDAVLAKVRALLAQAESTTFEAEAATFTAKAQELMARYAIDAALLADRRGSTERTVAIRIDIDEPYADAKADLLHVVAKRSRCRAVFSPRYAFATVVGFAADLAATELLFTSLLVQSQTAMLAEGTDAVPGSRTRSRGFRSSFLGAYAYRVGQRLADTRSTVEADVAHGREDVLPVLAARQSAVDRMIDELFGEVRTRRRRSASDPLGWDRGRKAADLADLGNERLRRQPPDALSA